LAEGFTSATLDRALTCYGVLISPKESIVTNSAPAAVLQSSRRHGRLVCPAALLCEKSSHFRPRLVSEAVLAILAGDGVGGGLPCAKHTSKKSLTTGRHASCTRFDGGEESMSFHVVRHEHPNIFVVNRQTYETYRFTIGDGVALAHVGLPSDLAEARRTAIAFLTQRERENPPDGAPPTRA
jgi:hypothetical protein